MDLVMLAAFEPHTALIKGQPVQLDRGDVIASVRFLARSGGGGALGKPRDFWAVSRLM